MLSFNEPFSEEGRKRFGILIDRTYDNFVSRVAQGRQMSADEVEEVARGRPWTGTQAHKVGLVDEIGSFSNALDYAARLAGASDRWGVDIQQFPKPKKPIDQIIELMKMQSSANNTLDIEASLAQRFLYVVLQFFGSVMSYNQTSPEILSYEFLEPVK
jgi:protease-4